MVFDEQIVIEGVRVNGRRFITPDLPTCVVDDGVPSDASDDHLVAPADQFTFFIRSSDWPDATPPQIGDIIIRITNGQRFVISRVSRLGFCISLNARGR